MKVWITKYATEIGIIECESVGSSHIYDGAVLIIPHYPLPFDETVYKDGEWHVSRETAVAKAEEMRQKKIESLKKQIKKLEGMKFQ